MKHQNVYTDVSWMADGKTKDRDITVYSPTTKNRCMGQNDVPIETNKSANLRLHLKRELFILNESSHSLCDNLIRELLRKIE